MVTLITLAALALFGSLFIIALHIILKHQRAMVQRQVSIQNQQNKPNIAGMIDGVIQAIPEIQKTYNETAAQVKDKPAEEQKRILGPIKSRLDQAIWVRDNEALVKWGAPYADKIMNTLMKMFK